MKFRDYEAHGVGEYWIIEPDTEVLEQHVAIDGIYELRLNSGEGTVTSTAVPGFQIPSRALFDEAENMRVLRTLLA